MMNIGLSHTLTPILVNDDCALFLEHTSCIQYNDAQLQVVSTEVKIKRPRAGSQRCDPCA